MSTQLINNTSPLLSKVTVGFQQTVDELVARFDDSIPWQNKLKSNVGTVLMDMIAGTFTNNQYYLEFAAREAYLETAVRESSIYAITRALGVKIVRRTPASVLTEFFNPTIHEIYVPTGQLMSIEGRSFFTKTSFALKAGARIEISLFEGIFKSQTFTTATLDGSYPELLLNETGFIVSEDNIRVFVITPEGNEVEWGKHESTLFDLKSTDTVFLDSTTADGDVLLMFGDGRFGQRPDISSTIRVEYVLTNGVRGNAGLPGQDVKYAGDTNLKATTIEPVQGGTGVKDKIYYQKYAPFLYASKKRMVSPPDWYANIGLFPGVGDVSILSQRDIAPNDSSWMNVVRVCILPESGSSWGGVNPNPRSSKWINFLKWAADKTKCTIQTWNPERVPVVIDIEILVNRSENIEAVKAAAEKRIKDLFKHLPGTLGRSLAIDDIATAVKFDGEIKVRGIDYSKVKSPIEDIEPQSKLEYVSLKSLNVIVKYSNRDQF